MLDQGVYLPPSAFEVWFLSAAHDDRALDRILSALPAAARAAAAAVDRRTRSPMSDRTTVHLLRHGEVHNPEGVLYGRLPGYHLSELGLQMAQRVADAVGDRDITHVVASPLERAQETARPLAAARGLDIVTDARVIESTTSSRAAGSASATARPPSLVLARTCGTRSGRRGASPTRTVVARMMAAVYDARDAARGHEAVVVSHQLPIWTTRLHVEGRSFLHDPRKRQCTLCSLTSLIFDGDDLVTLRYSEPAADLIPVKDRKALFSAGGADDRRGHRPHDPRRRVLRRSPCCCAARLLAGCSNDTRRAATRGSSRARASSPRSTAADREAPGAVAGTTLDGDEVSLADFRGKVVVVNVWGSWCGPCRAEARMLADASRDLPTKGVEFLGIDSRDPSAATRGVRAPLPDPLPQHLRPAGPTLLAFRGTLPPNAVPSTVVIDAQGRVAASVIGPITRTTPRRPGPQDAS